MFSIEKYAVCIIITVKYTITCICMDYFMLFTCLMRGLIEATSGLNITNTRILET